MRKSVCVYTKQDYWKGITDKWLKIWIGSGQMLWEGNTDTAVWVFPAEALESRNWLLTVPDLNLTLDVKVIPAKWHRSEFCWLIYDILTAKTIKSNTEICLPES